MKNYLVHFLAVIPKQKRSMKTVKAKTTKEAVAKAKKAVGGGGPLPSFDVTRVLGLPGKYFVHYKTTVDEEKTGTVVVQADSEDQAVISAGEEVGKDDLTSLLPPFKSFKATKVVELGE